VRRSESCRFAEREWQTLVNERLETGEKEVMWKKDAKSEGLAGGETGKAVFNARPHV
jgi:hypothetical protein